MTNAEAIETLRANYPDTCFEQLREAVDTAIEALKAQDAVGDTISRRAALEICADELLHAEDYSPIRAWNRIQQLPPAQQQYEPVTAEDFAKTMSKYTFYSFMAWHGEALELMERQGFVICKKTI